MTVDYEKKGHIENGPLAVRTVKEIVLKAISQPRELGFITEMEIGGKVFKSEDVKEGPLAFLEKRKPQFKGR
jgi:enoyl-CoA hydratase